MTIKDDERLVRQVLERMKLAVHSLIELNNRMVDDDHVPAEYTEELARIVTRMKIPKGDRL